MTGYHAAGSTETGYDETGYDETGSTGPGGEPDEIDTPGRTGHSAVDAALRAVAVAGSAAPVDQIPAYQAAHRTLRDTLASIDEQ